MGLRRQWFDALDQGVASGCIHASLFVGGTHEKSSTGKGAALSWPTLRPPTRVRPSGEMPPPR